MPTPTFCCGFECGTAISNAGGSAHVVSLGTGVSFNTGAVRSGLRSLRINTTTTTITPIQTLLTGQTTTIRVWRYYVYIASHPNVDAVVGVSSIDSGANRLHGLGYKASDGLYYPCHDNGTAVFGAQGVALALNAWHRVDCAVNASANPWTIDCAVNGTPLTQLTRAAIAGSLNAQMYAGNVFQAVTTDMYVDDLLISQTAADYPLGAGSIEGFVPNADGTHTFTTTIGVRGTTGAPTGGGNIAGSSDSYEWINGRPILGGASDATRLWNQQGNGSTLYGEVQFQDAARVPRSVEVLVAFRDAGTGTGDRTAKLNDNGTEDTIYAAAVIAGITTDYARRKHYATAPSTGVAWTLALFNGLRFRFGYSGDANPDHYCRGVMIEAEFPPVSLPPFRPPNRFIPQSRRAA